jgi:hypothetical protein
MTRIRTFSPLFQSTFFKTVGVEFFTLTIYLIVVAGRFAPGNNRRGYHPRRISEHQATALIKKDMGIILDSIFVKEYDYVYSL